MMSNKPHPIESTKEWKAMVAVAMRESREELARTPVHLLDTGNPNHPIHDGIFGYATADLLAKQFAA